jgi:hypothetical protein
MAPKKGGKGGRPRKYMIEEAQAAKQAQDRQRQHRLQHAQVDEADPNELQVVITEAAIALTAPTGPAAPRKHPPTPSSCVQEPIPDNCPTGEPNDSPQLDGIGGDIGEGSWGRHTSEDVYEVSDGEQEARRLATGQWDDQDDAEIAQLATRLGGQSLEPSGSPIPGPSSGSPIPSGSPILEPNSSSPIPEQEPTQSPISGQEPSKVELGERSTATRLLKQLHSFQGCTDEAHQAHDDEHAQFQFHPREEPCHSFADLLHLQELKPSGPVPDVLSSLTMMGKGPESPEFDPALAQQLYEGRDPRVPLSEGLEPAASLCLPHKVPGQPNPRGSVMYDIDSVCLFPTSLAVAKQGLHWQPIPHPIVNITTNVHFTLLVDCYNDEGELERVEKPLHKIPHCCLGEFSGFKALHLFAFFPKLALHPNPTTTFLTDKQQSL